MGVMVTSLSREPSSRDNRNSGAWCYMTNKVGKEGREEDNNHNNNKEDMESFIIFTSSTSHLFSFRNPLFPVLQ